MSMLRETHHEKICLHLLENGGEATHSSLGDWAGTTLGMAKQDFSDLADGMVEEGLLRWDGTTLSLHSEGRALGAKVKAQGVNAPAVNAPVSTSTSDPAAGAPKKGKKKKAEPGAKPADAGLSARAAVAAVVAPKAAPVAAPVAAAPVAAAPVAAAPVAGASEDGHDHGHSHGHGHDHGHAASAEQEPRPPRAKPSEPRAVPPRGLLGRLRCRIKKLLGR